MDTTLHSTAMDLHERLLTARRGQRRADFQLAMLLAEMAAGRLYLQLGYWSLVNYAEIVLELTPRTTRELLVLGRRLPDLPHLGASMESGELDWTKAREILRVVTPETERAWLERASEVSSRVLEAEVAGALVGELPPEGPGERARRPARQRVVFEMESADAEVLRTAIAAIRAMTHVGRDELSDGAVLAGIARSALVAVEAEATSPESTPTGERYRVVVEHCPACRRTVSPDAEVSDTVAAEALCYAEIIDMRPGPMQGHMTHSVPDVTRRRVFHRAGWSCEVPGCTNRVWLDIHHMVPRAEGGKHNIQNLAVLCCAHHRCIHDGTLAVELDQRAPGRVIEVRHADGRRARSAPYPVGPARPLPDADASSSDPLRFPAGSTT